MIQPVAALVEGLAQVGLVVLQTDAEPGLGLDKKHRVPTVLVVVVGERHGQPGVSDVTGIITRQFGAAKPPPTHLRFLLLDGDAAAEISVCAMRLRRTPPSVMMIVGAALSWLLVGCGAQASGSVATQPTATAAVPATSATATPAGGVMVTGDVRRPGPTTVTQLTGMTQHTVSVQFSSGKGAETHTETGVLLSDLLPVSALATTSRKNDQLAFAVLATGSDGYAALVAYGEIAPDFGNRGVLLATAQDGAALPHPRLVVPGDVKGGRYVSDVVDLRVVRVG